MKHTYPAGFLAACALVTSACAHGETATVGVTTPTNATVSRLLGSGQACVSNGDCDSGFCDHPIADCNGQGTCARVPSCTATGSDDDQRVCGCDGQTYYSDCDAREKIMSIRAPGPCLPAP